MPDTIEPQNDAAKKTADVSKPGAQQLIDRINEEFKDIRNAFQSRCTSMDEALAKLATISNPEVQAAIQNIANWEEQLGILVNGKDDGEGSLMDRLSEMEVAFDKMGDAPDPTAMVADPRALAFEMFADRAAENPNFRDSLQVDPRLTDDYARALHLYLRKGEPALAHNDKRFHLARGASFVRDGWDISASNMERWLSPEVQNNLSTDWAPGGGIFVTPTQEERIISKVQEGAALLSLAGQKTTNSNRHEFTRATGRKPTVFQRGERQDMQRNTERTFWQKFGIDIHEDQTEIELTRAAIEDSGRDIVQEIEALVVDEQREVESKIVWDGDGQNEGQGLLSDSDVQIIKTGTADTLPLFRLTQVHVDIKPKFLPNAAYILSIGALMAAVLENDGLGRPLWQPSLPDGTPTLFNGYRWHRDAFLTREIAVSDSAVTFATGAKVVTFGDHAEAFWQVRRRGTSVLFDEITHKGFIIYTWFRRWGCGVANPDAVRIVQVST